MSKKKRAQQYLRHTDHIQETPLILIKRKDNYIRVRVQVLRFHAFERTKPPVEGRQGIHTHKTCILTGTAFHVFQSQGYLVAERTEFHQSLRYLGGAKVLSPAGPQGTWWPKGLSPASPQGTWGLKGLNPAVHRVPGGRKD